jgi:hypothetical protein
MKTITWTITLGYSAMKSPFSVGDTVKHFGEKVTIIAVKKDGVNVTFTAQKASA